MIRDSIYDVIVIGGGHAGVEAALSTARAGYETLMLTMSANTICQMSCNPAIGGIAKGQMVREIDALGGEMAKAIDATGIQFRMLNRSKGPAMWSPRAQADKQQYQRYMQQVIETTPHLTLIEAEVSELIIEEETVKGVREAGGKSFWGRFVIITTGTFLKGLIHVGDENKGGGRRGESSAQYLSDSLRQAGIQLGRFKTGTPPRLKHESIDYSVLQAQPGDKNPEPFSYQTKKIDRPEIECHITYTNDETHKTIRDNLQLSPLYSGRIEGIGPRYCPSIEDKVVKFSDKPSHQLYLEPEGLETNSIYVNGLSMSLPQHIQIKLVRTIKGLENVDFLFPAYAIEYDYVPPHQIEMTFESKAVKNLFVAGQINGTSGYEEAAAQGLLAGLNVIRKIKKEDPFILRRSEAYMGVLVDDLVTRGTNEPYRMFTSRAEFRLLLRQDNADERLMNYGHKFGLIPEDFCRKTQSKYERAYEEINRLKNTYHRNKSLEVYLKRPGSSYESIPKEFRNEGLGPEEKLHVELNLRYEGYIKRQQSEIKKFRRMESHQLPPSFDYSGLDGVTREAKEKLSKYQPTSIGQASRIPGITSCDLSVLLVHLKKSSQQSAFSSPKK